MRQSATQRMIRHFSSRSDHVIVKPLHALFSHEKKEMGGVQKRSPRAAREIFPPRNRGKKSHPSASAALMRKRIRTMLRFAPPTMIRHASNRSDRVIGKLRPPSFSLYRARPVSFSGREKEMWGAKSDAPRGAREKRLPYIEWGAQSFPPLIKRRYHCPRSGQKKTLPSGEKPRDESEK